MVSTRLILLLLRLFLRLHTAGRTETCEAPSEALESTLNSISRILSSTTTHVESMPLTAVGRVTTREATKSEGRLTAPKSSVTLTRLQPQAPQVFLEATRLSGTETRSTEISMIALRQPLFSELNNRSAGTQPSVSETTMGTISTLLGRMQFRQGSLQRRISEPRQRAAQMLSVQ